MTDCRRRTTDQHWMAVGRWPVCSGREEEIGFASFN
jgi:hypothetical protein